MNLRDTARAIFDEAVKAADPYACIERTVRLDVGNVVIAGRAYPKADFPRIVVVGGGKASARMGEALEHILGDRIDGGWINTKDGHGLPLERITVHECSHPVPDERGVAGTRRIIDLLDSADEQTLVICLLSGGGSALMPAPAGGIILAEKQTVTKLLLAAGAEIGEINTIRKHLSSLKGGGMARLASPAALHVLILSDVIGDRLDTIASGPAAADPGTFADCLAICGRYGIMDDLPAAVRERFESGAAGNLPETAKSGDPFFDNAANTIIGNNRMSVNAAVRAARSYGFETLVLSTAFRGEASQLGTFFAAVASEIRACGQPAKAPACIIGGGETTVTIRGAGSGGRNQEMALAAAIALDGSVDTVFLSGGTDGTDGPTGAAGGIVDGETVHSMRTAGIDPAAALADNDSYHCLRAADSLVVTGPTGTNVMDIHLLVVGDGS